MQLEAGARAGEMLDRDVNVAGHRVVQGQVSLAEGAAHGVLPGEPDRAALEQQRAEGERFGLRPLDVRLRVVERRQAPVELLDQLRAGR